MARTATILHIGLQIAANLAIAFEPFLPFSAKKLRDMLGMETFSWNDLGSIELLKEGAKLGETQLLFDKIEDSVVEAQVQKLLDTKKANELAAYKPAEVKPNVAFDEWEKTDIRVATVLECTKVPKADKLLQFKLDDGMGGRTIVSGIAQSYPNPEELVGTQVLFIANFEPRKLKGIVSEGMILSAVDADGKLVLCRPSREVKPGCSVG
jgi:methionyl-tRNA synthetase